MRNRLLITLLLLLTGPLSQVQAQDAEPLMDRIVAVVGDDVIVSSELQQEEQKLGYRLQQANSPMPPRSVIRRQALEKLILEKLQVAEAERLGISVDDKTVAQGIADIAKRNDLTVAELRRTLEDDGIPFEQFRNSMRDQIMLTQLRNREVVNRIQVTDAEIDNYLAKHPEQAGGRTAVHLRQLLVAVPKDATDTEIQAAQQKAQRLFEELSQGADFATLASQESDGQQAANGGDLGWLEMAQVPTLFASAVTDLKRGGLAGPLHSASGFHIVKLEDYRGGDRNIIQQTHVRHILIRTGEATSDQDARTRLAQLRQRIIGGDDFSTLARSHSDDKASAVKGGDLGWVSPGFLVPQFEEVMNRLAPGEISQPFKTPFGWHIVQVLDRRQHDATDEMRRDKAKLAIRNRKASEAMQAYLRRLRDEAYVELRLEDNF